MNDWDITASQLEVVRMMLAVAGGEMDEKGMGEWLRLYSEPLAEDEE